MALLELRSKVQPAGAVMTEAEPSTAIAAMRLSWICTPLGTVTTMLPAVAAPLFVEVDDRYATATS